MDEKLRCLHRLLRGYGSVLVAFSGGVDSSFLLREAVTVLGRQNVLAVTSDSPIHPPEEKESALVLASRYGVRHICVTTDELASPEFVANPPDRCFHCKKGMFGCFETLRKRYVLECIADGTNTDDSADFRPGERAKKLYGVVSPLKMAGISKREIRDYMKVAGEPAWNKPSMACLATRIPYGQEITPDKIDRIASAERFCRTLGFQYVRVRDYGLIARIEVCQQDMPGVLRHKREISEKLKNVGYCYVTLDLEGFRSGSMNEALPVCSDEQKKRSRCNERRR